MAPVFCTIRIKLKEILKKKSEFIATKSHDLIDCRANGKGSICISHFLEIKIFCFLLNFVIRKIEDDIRG